VDGWRWLVAVAPAASSLMLSALLVGCRMHIYVKDLVNFGDLTLQKKFGEKFRHEKGTLG
jgi:hypothetical protein